MSEKIDLESIAIIYDGDYLSNVPNTYKSFLELLRDKAGLSNEEFKEKTIWRGDFPITNRNDYIRAIKSCKDEGIMQIDLVTNELDENEGITEKDYMKYLESNEKEDIITIEINEEENKEETIYIESNINEFYAVTNVIQYYKNNNNKPVELSIIYPFRREVQFRKFTILIDGKKAISKILEKEKGEEKYSDSIAGSKTGIFLKYLEKDPYSYSINIGNINPNSIVELNSEFIQFLSSNDMSFCYSTMLNYPNFSDSISKNYLKNINGKIILNTHSKITRLIHQNFTIDKYFKQTFNENYTSCEINYKVLNDSKNYNTTLNILFRTEKMNEPYLLSQYNPEKDETSYLFGMIYDQKKIPNPEKPDLDNNINYYSKYENNESTDTPSLFIFLIDQSGSMSGTSIKLVSDSLLFFLQSLPKDSYYQLIGFGSIFKKINEKPVLYSKENVKNTMEIIKNLKANLGGTNISSPLKEIFNSQDYDNIKLGRNLFILTDGEVDDREECLDLISKNSDKYKIHSIGIGSSFDKKLIQSAGLQGKGSYHFVNNISDVNSVIIQSLSKCLRNYLLDVKLSLINLKAEYEFFPNVNFIYPDEILNYYFILKGKNKENIEIYFESSKKNEKIIISEDKIIKEKDGEIISQIIIGNILKNPNEKLDEDLEIKLSKNYQILSQKTSLFAEIEGEETNKIGELKQISNKKKINNNAFLNKFNIDIGSEELNNINNYNQMLSIPIIGNAAPFKQMALMDYGADDDDLSDDAYENEAAIDYGKFEECSNNYKCQEKDCNDDDMDLEEDVIGNYDNNKLIKGKNEKIEIEKKIEFNPKELVLTQDIFDGCWNLNPYTKLLIEKEKNIYEKIEKIVQEKKLEQNEIKITLLVLYYLKTDSSINQIEYSLIIKKGIKYLENSGINFEEIFNSIKN